MSADTEALLATVREALDKLDDEGACTCREKASVGVLYLCEHHLSQSGLAALSSLAAEFEQKQERLDWYEGLQGDASDADFVSILREEIPMMEAELERLRISEQMQPIRAGWKKRAEAAEAELERLQVDGEQFWADRHVAHVRKIGELEAELERVKAERDGARSDFIAADAEVQRLAAWEPENELRERIEQAEARLDKALAALREIANSPPMTDVDMIPASTMRSLRAVASRAIAEIEGEA